uniref:NADH-ubiquinone oxidoreductase chain 2 n=1 Tax=Apteronotus albifrons TaxID=36673 RepID=Q85DZ6_APTAL|nr:NADH dehydrogenase subunit 2 [Apteronotus albifrons]BAC67495.1 NADH dehydrogenase subunit 2 [Apteronotus albifrons]
MSPLLLFIFLSALGLGTTITFASSHWFMAWMGLEVNTLAIIPLMTFQPHPRAVEAATKYFLIQATAAAVLLMATTTNAWYSGEWNINCLTHTPSIILATLALTMKIGIAPLHLWLPEVMQGLNLFAALILATWQKLAPIILLMQISPKPCTALMTLGLLSVLVGGWGGLNQTQIRKLMAYSSIAHMGWILSIMSFSPHLALLALLTYILMTMTALLSFKLSKSVKINILALTWSKNPTLALIIMLVLLSLGGLPPLTGFMPKLLILTELIYQDLPLFATLMALTALLSLFYYLRLCYIILLTTSPNTNQAKAPWRLIPNTKSMTIALTSALSTALLPFTPLLLVLTMTH